MAKFIIRRILLFVPTLFIITLLAFLISVYSPGNPIDVLMNNQSASGEMQIQSKETLKQKELWRKKLGLDLPIFYLSINPLSYPKDLHKITNGIERKNLERLLKQFGNWQEIQTYYKTLKQVQQNAAYANKKETYYLVSTLLRTHEKGQIKRLFLQLSIEKEELGQVISAYTSLKIKSTVWKNYVPSIHFHENNQYHRWLFGDGNWLTGKNTKFSKGIIRGDFGISYQTHQPVAKKIGSKLFWSVLLAMLSVFLAYIISIPVGVWAAVKKNKPFDRISAIVLFILYSLPSFWLAVLLLMTFANPDALQIFPASGVKPIGGYPETADLWNKIGLSLPYLILPIICYTYSSFSFLSRTMRASMLEVISENFIRTAKAKGLPLYKVLFKHGLRNALLPLVTIFTSIFPAAIGGAVILETIFTIPGMGYEIYTAIYAHDYPMLIAVFTLTGMLTVIGYLLADVVYALVDPRIKYS